jgi:hypothetical protein
MTSTQLSGIGRGITARRLAVLFAVLGAGSAQAQTVEFRYVGPNATMQATFPPPSIDASFAQGYGAVLVDASNQAAMLAVASPHMRHTFSALQPGQPFRARVDRMLRINGGLTDLTIVLADDRAGLTEGHTGIFFTSTIAGKVAVWPAASVAPAVGNRYRGVIRLGELAANFFQARPGAWRAWESVILHESLHTQFVGEKTRWGSISIVYGGDGKHYISEIAGEQENPLEEGLATFFGMTHNDPNGMADVADFFARDDERYFIESRSVLAGVAEAWNAPHREEEHPLTELSPDQRTGRYLWRYYRWRDVPAFFILFSESTSMALHGYFWKHVNGDRDQALAMIEASARSMAFNRRKRFAMYDVNRLALQLESFSATADGRAARAAGRLTSSMFPFALLDLITHFGMSEVEFRRLYEQEHPDRQPLAYERYWAHRARVRELVRDHLEASPMRWEEAVTAVHGYFRQVATLLSPP